MEKTDEHYLLAGLPTEERAYLFNNSIRQHLATETLIFQKGETAHYFYLIQDGSVRVYFSTPDGREKTIRTFHAPDSFADAVMFMHRDAYPANASTITNCDLLAIPIQLFKRIMAERPEVYLSIIGHLIEHIRRLNHQLEMLSVMDTKSRLLKYISHQLPANWQNKSTYPIAISKKDLAEYLAMRPETLSRSLKSIEQDGTLIWGKDGVTLLQWPPKN